VSPTGATGKDLGVATTRVRAGGGGTRRSRSTEATRARAVRIVALVAALVLLVVAVVVIVQAQQTAPCDNVHFRSSAGSVNPSSQPPPIGSNGIVRDLRQFFQGGSAAVFCNDFPDPFVLRNGSSYYAYATDTAGYNIPVLATHGLFGSGGRREALPSLPAWAEPGWTWAPSVLPRGQTFVLYYAARPRGLNRECLSIAVASNPLGPFVDRSSGPAVCPPGGAIDPSPVVTPSGQAFLVWKNDDAIVSQPLAPDGRSLVGSPSRLLVADQPWEGGVVEGPSMVFAGGRYYLFYSANQWSSASYAIGYAVCGSPSGPCAKQPGPWLASGDNVEGPGGPEFFTDTTGQLWMTLHAWVHHQVGYPQGARDLFVLKIGFVNGVPVPT
jgi:hypothetical protein